MHIEAGESVRISLGTSMSAARVVGAYFVMVEAIETDTLESAINKWLEKTQIAEITAILEAAIASGLLTTSPANHSPDGWYADAYFPAWLISERPDLIQKTNDRFDENGDQIGGRTEHVQVLTGQTDDGEFLLRKIGQQHDITMYSFNKDAEGSAKDFWPAVIAERQGMKV